MKNILLIGVGGTGSKAVDIFFQKRQELGNQTGNNITALVFDTDAGDLKKITAAKTVVMADNASVGTICDRFGKEFLKEWFPSDDKAVRSQEMIRGASQWRKKSYLAFLNLMNKPLARSTFISALEQMTADPGASCEIYVIASVAGGTGSGSFIPIALYAKRYLRRTLGKDPIVNAMIALPDIYADSQTPENRIKVYSNAYAILRELNAINLVARNYNAGLAEHKKAPIKFKIGDENEPSVGLLFDASNKQFWTPEAAPFSQVFLLDRIPGLNSVAAHDIVLANSLYTMLCTDIGAAFDSEFSNHELLRSQSNGSNAIYAGISTSQIRFPKESVLDYLAHKKTLDSCDNEWLILHKATENAIREREQQMRACNRRYNMKDGEYAEIVVEELRKLEEAGNDGIVSIMERCVDVFDKEGNKISKTTAKSYVERIDKYIAGQITSKDNITREVEKKVASLVPEKGKIEKDILPTCAKDLNKKILDYYTACLENIKRMSGSTADAIITLDKKKCEYIGDDLSIEKNLLKKGDNYIHPVAAMIQLCRLRKDIKAEYEKAKGEEWEDLTKRNVTVIPESILAIPDDLDLEVSNISKSKYFEWGESRFSTLSGTKGVSMYPTLRTDTKVDMAILEQDAYAVINKIYFGAQTQLRARVYQAIAHNVDILIAKYRNFFNRFEKEKEDLVELTKNAYRKDSGNVDSVINVYSSMGSKVDNTIGDKDVIYKNILENSGPATDAEVIATDNIVGDSVYGTVYNSAAAEFAQDNSFNDKDSGAFRSLFENMVKAYRASIAKSDEFEKIASYNVIEAMVASCGDGADEKAIDDTFKSKFSIAQDLATPSLRLDATDREHDLVQPSYIMVFMMSIGTGKYIKKHAEEFGLRLPADQTKEFEVIKSCSEEFIRRYSGNNSARVSIVSSMPDQVLYCTGEIMDITPLRISKFNEIGDDNIYFKNYTTAIANYKKYGTDMWNPHLGNNLHKRGYLPYMNEEKENECDIQVVKALIYGFQSEHILYNDGVGEAQDKYFFTCDGKKIIDSEGKWINNKNIAQLLDWLRNEDEIVEEWSEAFDRDIMRQLNSLPSIASDNSTEISALESALTGSLFMQLLTERLYVDGSTKGTRDAKRVKIDKKPMYVDREGPTLLDFAYMIKTSEELGRDCDDAERVLTVVYDAFKSLCSHRANPQNYPERFIQVYKQQLGNVYETLATSKTVCKAGTECKSHFNQFVSWLHQTGVFDTISKYAPMDSKGNVCINTLFKAEDSTEVKKILDFIKKGGKNEDIDLAPEAADDIAKAE